jgi:Icc-related predicted phosphoesterase
MIVALASDLHLEFADINLQNTEGAEVLILSGDILIAEDLHSHPETKYSHLEIKVLQHGQARAQKFRDFLKRCSFQFPHVVYVAGNHEFYHGRWTESIQHLREECAKFPNVYFLEQDIKVINDVTFMGGTLWTDCNKGDPLTLHALTDMMNDFKIIRNDDLGYTKLRPAHTAMRHRKTVQYFDSILADRKDQKCVVVGHHAPTSMSTHARYVGQDLMNGGYRSDLSEFIMDHPQIKLWTHGHMHDPFDYTIGETRVVCNPRGYSGHDEQADVFELKFLDI